MIVHAADEDSRDLAQYLALKHGGSCEIWSVSDDGLDNLATRGLKGLDPGSWTRCHFGYAASVRVADLAAA